MRTGLSVVTGGAGFIGRHLVARLAAEGQPVRVIDPAPRPASFAASVDYRQVSVLDAEAVQAALTGAHELYHLAALAHLWSADRQDFERINVEGTRIVLDAARQAGVPRIVVTSTEVILRGWRDLDPNPVTEAEIPPVFSDLAGPYSRSKAKAHALALDAAQAGLSVRIVYPTVPVGPGDAALTAPTQMIRDFLKGDTPAFLDCLLNLVPVEDVAQGHILAARKGEAHGRYILGGQNLWLREILDMLRPLAARPLPRRPIPYALAHAVALVSTVSADYVTKAAPRAPLEGVKLAYAPREVDSGHARRALGFMPGPVGPALERAARWLAAEGHVPPMKVQESPSKP